VYNDDGTCSIIANGNAILFGGDAEKRQIAVVYRKGIKRIGTLPFDFFEGRCHFNNGTVFLCFGDDSKLCRTRYLDYNNSTVESDIQVLTYFIFRVMIILLSKNLVTYLTLIKNITKLIKKKLIKKNRNFKIQFFTRSSPEVTFLSKEK